MSEWSIPLSDLDYGVEEEAAVQRVLRGRWLSMGPEVQAFERQFAQYIGTKHALAVANGTAALHLAYLALGLGSNDEIIQPAINFVAAANTTVAVGAIPVFADIVSLSEPTVSPEEIERRITPQTKAVVVMHYGGYTCRMAEILDLCKRRGLALVEDACHAVGGRYHDPGGQEPHGKRAGNLGDVACFSFFSNKNLAMGEGGMITTNRDDIADQVRRYRSHGMSTLTWDRHRGHASTYDVSLHGFNYRMDEIRAALGCSQLAKLDNNNIRRKELVAIYRSRLSDLPDWILPFADHFGQPAYHLMVAVAPDKEKRQETALQLRQNGIQTSLHYPCITDFTAFAVHGTSQVTELSRSFAQRTITLPLFPTMTSKQVETVCEQVMRASGSLRTA